MQQEMSQLIEQSTETTLAAARKVGELNLRTFDRLFQQQADLATYYVDASARSMELLTKAKGYQDLLAGQTALLREFSERNIDAVRKGISLVNESAAEYGALAQEGFKVAQDHLTRASEVTAKAAA